MLRVTFVFALTALLSACISKDGAESAMAGFPMHNVKLGGPAPGVCDWNQKTGVHYTGIDDDTGKPVSGVLCMNVYESNSTIHPDR